MQLLTQPTQQPSQQLTLQPNVSQQPGQQSTQQPTQQPIQQPIFRSTYTTSCGKCSVIFPGGSTYKFCPECGTASTPPANGRRRLATVTLSPSEEALCRRRLMVRDMKRSKS